MQPSQLNLLKLLDDFNAHNFWNSLLIQLKSNIAHKAVLAYDLIKQSVNFTDTYLAPIKHKAFYVVIGSVENIAWLLEFPIDLGDKWNQAKKMFVK